ncbi:hypothetical protein BC629DRAFT_48381 [Irpex lacteus]|nr:hypothetical protein BC629DRAFT_48381 [Irpex lacteus]
MLSASKLSSVNNKLVRPGIYEIQSSATSLFLNSFEDPVYNGRCDDALTFKKLPTRRGKVREPAIGTKLPLTLSSGDSKASAMGTRSNRLSAACIARWPTETSLCSKLSLVPTVWTIKHMDEESDKVRIIWSVSGVAWEAYRSKDERVAWKLVINSLKPARMSRSHQQERLLTGTCCQLRCLLQTTGKSSQDCILYKACSARHM